MILIASIIIAVLIIIVLAMGALLHQQAERIHDLKTKLFHTDEALTDALEGQGDRLYSEGMDVKIRSVKPWEEFGMVGSTDDMGTVKDDDG